MKIIERWPAYFITWSNRELDICNIVDDNGNPNNPDGDYYIVETDNTNGYGYHLGGEPRLTVEPADLIDQPSCLTRGLGHSRTIAKIIIRAGVAETIPHNRVLRNEESS